MHILFTFAKARQLICNYPSAAASNPWASSAAEAAHGWSVSVRTISLALWWIMDASFCSVSLSSIVPWAFSWSHLVSANRRRAILVGCTRSIHESPIQTGRHVFFWLEIAPNRCRNATAAGIQRAASVFNYFMLGRISHCWLKKLRFDFPFCGAVGVPFMHFVECTFLESFPSPLVMEWNGASSIFRDLHMDSWFAYKRCLGPRCLMQSKNGEWGSTRVRVRVRTGNILLTLTLMTLTDAHYRNSLVFHAHLSLINVTATIIETKCPLCVFQTFVGHCCMMGCRIKKIHSFRYWTSGCSGSRRDER